jgi:soluble lytic murein transglycosylase-like protein
MVYASIILVLSGVPSAEVGLEALARADRWEQVLQVAARRREQLPLRPEEALVAAHAARLTGDSAAQAHYLELALNLPDDLEAVARVELAELVLVEDPGRAFDLTLGLVRKAPTNQLRRAARDVVEASVAAGVETERRSSLERLLPSLSRSYRRGLELVLATSADPVDRSRLSRLLASSTADLVALTAADALGDPTDLGILDRWRVAQTFYRHGLFDRAVPILEDLDSVRHGQIPRWEVAYLRGRCAFRRGDWATATTWYQTAISRTSAGERRARLEVHLGRTHELAGEMDDAIAAAQRAVRLRTTDDRRLFLARLRLRRGEPDLAQAGINRIRSRSARARGELMLGLFELRAGSDDAARRRLDGVSRDPWRAPAGVIAAELAESAGESGAALETLRATSAGFDVYWAEEARVLMGGFPAEVVDVWRHREQSELDGAKGRSRQRVMSRRLKLEPDGEQLASLSKMVAGELGLAGELEKPEFPEGLADRLWSLGLLASAVRWDPSGLPRETARSTWWTAEQELELGRPWLALSAADSARRQASPVLPARGLPVGLQRALYPLPFESTVRRAAARHGLRWSLLAGVAREESRWDPEVVSKVGARGLMQLMPATAVATGVANGRPEISPDDLFEPFISLDLGAAELGRLLEVFDGNRAAAVAAYNAGEAQAKLWLDQCGQGCTEARFLAHVSFSVTRGYTEAVLGAATAYEGLYGAAPSEVSGRSE